MIKKAAFLSLMLLLTACGTVPITGRQQLSLYGESEMTALGAQTYREVVGESKVIRTGAQARMVQTVGIKIKNAVADYFRQQGQAELLDSYKWEFSLIESDEKNAFCLPGGKVAVYSGILDVTQSETGLAVVMGHEVAHAVANHGNERMSQELLMGVAGAALTAAIAGDDPVVEQAFSTAFGIGAQLGVMLPFSRMHESEADGLGLIFMSMAGYDPHEAPNFWRRMAAANGGGAPLEFLSTHPSDETRIADLEGQIAAAMAYYKPGGSNSRAAASQSAATQSAAAKPAGRKPARQTDNADDEDEGEVDVSVGAVVNKSSGKSKKRPR